MISEKLPALELLIVEEDRESEVWHNIQWLHSILNVFKFQPLDKRGLNLDLLIIFVINSEYFLTARRINF